MTDKQKNIVAGAAIAIVLLAILFKDKLFPKQSNSVGGAAAGGNTPNNYNEYADFIGRKAEITTVGDQKTASDTPKYPNTGSQPIYLNLTNQSNQTQNVTLFDVTNKYDQQAANGATFAYDLTTELANAAINGNKSIVVIARPTAGGAYQVYQYTSATPITTITDALTGLNSLGLGTWVNPSGNNVSLTSPTYFLSSVSITDIFTANAVSASAYSATGALVYDSGFQTNGVGTVTLIDITNGFWRNIPANTTDGAMNRNAIWNNASIPLLEWIGTDINVYMPEAGTVYIGVGSDNLARFWVNGVLTLSMDVNAMKTSLDAQLPAYSYVTAGQIPFYWWHIFPINLPAGYSSIMVQNENTGASGALGVEVYNNTAAQIEAATSYAGLNILFRSANLVGTNSLY